MTTSTEKTVRDAIVAAIQGIFATLGFSAAPGNVQAYMLDYHQPEEFETYLLADTTDGKQLRAHAVDVVASDDWFATGGQIIRRYTITTRQYYALGQNGAGVNLLIDHERAVRAAIIALTSRLSNTVSMIDGVSQLSRQVQPTPLDALGGFMVVGTRTYEATRVHPDF